MVCLPGSLYVCDCQNVDMLLSVCVLVCAHPSNCVFACLHVCACMCACLFINSQVCVHVSLCGCLFCVGRPGLLSVRLPRCVYVCICLVVRLYV